MQFFLLSDVTLVPFLGIDDAYITSLFDCVRSALYVVPPPL